MTSVPERLERRTPQANVDGARFAQLVYTSFDERDGSGGGWRVKQETGDLTPAERQELTNRITTRFDVGDPLPQYPNDAEIAGRPARLMYAALTGERAGYWHTVDAGKDATGRPGNVVAHVVLDRRFTSPGELRPIELWGSPQWLRPYGPAEVTAAELASTGFPAPSGDFTAGSVVGFLTAMSLDQQIFFRVLLDAVHGAMSGGRGVILTTHELRTGPWWIAALSYFMSPGTARRFTWSTYDDPQLAAADIRAGVHLVVVASGRARDLPRGDWLVLDELDQPFLGALGSTHGTGGSGVDVTSWSILAEAVLADPDMATRLIVRQDEIASEVGDRDLSPVWPLAIAVREERALAEFHEEANRVVADDAPGHCESVPWIAELVGDAAAATAPADVGEALERLVAAHRRGVGIAAAAKRFLSLVLADDDWLSSGPLERVPVVQIVDASPLAAMVDEAFARAQNVEHATDVDVLRRTLRVFDLLDRIALPAAELERWRAPTTAVVAAHVHALSDATSARALTTDRGIRPDFREHIVRPAVAQLPSETLERFSIDVWDWLFDGHGAIPEIPANPHAYDTVLFPRYISVALAAAEHRHVSAERTEALAAEAITLALGADNLTDEDCRALLRTLASYAHLSASELAEDFARWPRRMPVEIATKYLLSESIPDQLVAAMAARQDDDGLTPSDRYAISAARLRLLNLQPRPWPVDQVRDAMDVVAPTLAPGLFSGRLAEVHDDVAMPFGALMVCGQALDSEWAIVDAVTTRAVNERLGPRINEVAELVADLVEAHIVEVEKLTALELLGRLGFTRTVRDVLSESQGGQPGLPDRVVQILLGRQTYAGPTDAAALRDAAWPHVRKMKAAKAESFFEDYPRAARDWLHDNGIGHSGSKSMFRRSNREE